MTQDEIKAMVEIVVNAPTASKRKMFGTFCRRVSVAVDAGTLTIQEGAYLICGTAARVTDILLPADRDIVVIAGNLELPEGQRDHTMPDWGQLKKRFEIL
jgi:hypothetical protein